MAVCTLWLSAEDYPTLLGTSFLCCLNHIYICVLLCSCCYAVVAGAKNPCACCNECLLTLHKSGCTKIKVALECAQVLFINPRHACTERVTVLGLRINWGAFFSVKGKRGEEKGERRTRGRGKEKGKSAN